MTDASTDYRAARDLLVEARVDDALAGRFRFPPLEGLFNWAHDWFDVVAAGQARAALVLVEEDGSRQSVTFDEMRLRSNALATFLGERGVGRGDHVMIMLGNQVELWETLLAVMKLGAVILPTTTALGHADLVDRVGRGAVTAVICNAADTAQFADVPGGYARFSVGAADGWHDIGAATGSSTAPVPHPQTTPDDTLLLYFTSGTTSRPKLVEHTQVSYPVGHLSTMYWLGLQPGDVHQNISSPGWAKHAWSCVFAPWIAEATVFIYNYARFDAAAVLAQLEAEDVTSFCAPPTVWRMLIQADLGSCPRSLREVLSAGEPLNPEVIAQVRSHWGLSIRDGYGQTETTLIVGNTAGAELKPGSMGKPMPGCSVVLVDPVSNGLVTAPGDGEICLDLGARPLNLMKGYADDPSLNAEAMAGGYYHTGDVATVDTDGYITYLGRTDDVFKASDYKISPFELESALIEHPAVAEAAVVPAPDPVRLAVPKAYVALAAGYEADADTARNILQFARTRLSPYQRVRRIEFFELPKTISGKIRRVELRRREDDLAASGARSGWSDEDFPELKSERR